MTAKIMDSFEVAPRKTVTVFEPYDYRGNRYPRELAECYGRYSSAKRYAWDYCKWLYDELDGRKFSITSYNTFQFTVQFEFMHPESGELMRAIITRDHNRAYRVA